MRFHSLSRLRRQRLAAARSRRGSDSPPDCHSLPRRHFATPEEEPTLKTNFIKLFAKPLSHGRAVTAPLKGSQEQFLLIFCQPSP